MSIITGDDDEVTERASETIHGVTCEDRGEGLKPRHVYLDGSRKCACGKGPNLAEQRIR